MSRARNRLFTLQTCPASSPSHARAKTLAALHRAAGLTQAEFADLIGDVQPNIACWQASEKPPRPVVLPKLAKVLGVSVMSSCGLLQLPAHPPGLPGRRQDPGQGPLRPHRLPVAPATDFRRGRGGVSPADPPAPRGTGCRGNTRLVHTRVERRSRPSDLVPRSVVRIRVRLRAAAVRQESGVAVGIVSIETHGPDASSAVGRRSAGDGSRRGGAIAGHVLGTRGRPRERRECPSDGRGAAPARFTSSRPVERHHQQAKIIDLVEALVDQHRRKAS
jgi:hypothetical protein